MKKYNVQNYIRYKEDLKRSIPNHDAYETLKREQLIVKFTPLVENLARKFSTSQQASGVLTIMDLIQIGNESLIKAVDKLDWTVLDDSDDIEVIKEYYGYNNTRAREVLSLLSPEKIKIIKEKVSRGGRRK